ncbi:MAG: tyrosine--tRNA ligase [Patescibacteria group bacterium]|jgi:tyrosyl-tRNA synthetase
MPKRIATDNRTIAHILDRSTVTIIDRKNLEKRLKSGKPLRVKLGIDPTGPNLHLGHAVQLRKLKQFQDAGHKVVIVIGDWTARIGDPTERNEMRPQLTAVEVKKNTREYLKQLFLILNKKETEVVWQSSWFNKFGLDDVFDLLSKWTVSQLLDRDDFKKRLSDGTEVGYHEPIYSLLQAYDSIMVKADVEIGATEQLFNLLRGRDLQNMQQQTPQEIMTLDILIGLDGKRKMGKSHNNYIALLDSGEEMYGKVMSIPDELIPHYFELTTELPDAEVTNIKKRLQELTVNPRDLKMRLAREIVTLYYDAKTAKAAEQQFINVFQKKIMPEHIEVVLLSSWPNTLAHAVVATTLAHSMSEARRTIEQGGIKINGEVEKNPNKTLPKNADLVLSRGKRLFKKIALKNAAT